MTYDGSMATELDRALDAVMVELDEEVEQEIDYILSELCDEVY